MKYVGDMAEFLLGAALTFLVIIGLVTILSGCRVLHVEVHAEPGSTVIIDAEMQADKPIDFTGGGLKVPFLP